jgi:hypothetical protein
MSKHPGPEETNPLRRCIHASLWIIPSQVACTDPNALPCSCRELISVSQSPPHVVRGPYVMGAAVVNVSLSPHHRNSPLGATESHPRLPRAIRRRCMYAESMADCTESLIAERFVRLFRMRGHDRQIGGYAPSELNRTGDPQNEQFG